MGKMTVDGTGFEIYERGNWKGNPKILKQILKSIPIVKQGYKIRDVDDILKALKFQ